MDPIPIEQFRIESNPFTNDDNSKLEIKVMSKVLF